MPGHQAQHLARLPAAGLRLRRLVPAEGPARAAPPRPRSSCVDLPLLDVGARAPTTCWCATSSTACRAVDATGDRRSRCSACRSRPTPTTCARARTSRSPSALIGKGCRRPLHDPVINTAKLFGANRATCEAKLPHLRSLLHDDPAEALAGAHVAIVSSADARRRRRRRGRRPPTSSSTSTAASVDARGSCTGYVGVGW